MEIKQSTIIAVAEFAAALQNLVSPYKGITRVSIVIKSAQEMVDTTHTIGDEERPGAITFFNAPKAYLNIYVNAKNEWEEDDFPIYFSETIQLKHGFRCDTWMKLFKPHFPPKDDF